MPLIFFLWFVVCRLLLQSEVALFFLLGLPLTFLGIPCLIGIIVFGALIGIFGTLLSIFQDKQRTLSAYFSLIAFLLILFGLFYYNQHLNQYGTVKSYHFKQYIPKIGVTKENERIMELRYKHYIDFFRNPQKVSSMADRQGRVFLINQKPVYLELKLRCSYKNDKKSVVERLQFLKESIIGKSVKIDMLPYNVFRRSYCCRKEKEGEDKTKLKKGESLFVLKNEEFLTLPVEAESFNVQEIWFDGKRLSEMFCRKPDKSPESKNLKFHAVSPARWLIKSMQEPVDEEQTDKP